MACVLWLLLFWWQAADPLAEGNKALEARQFDAAISAFQRAIAADKSDVQAHFNLALAYSEKGDNANAATEYREVLRLSPGLYQAEMNLGLVLMRAGSLSEALPFLAAAVEHKPTSGPAHRSYGDGLLAAKKYPEAEQQYQSVTPRDGDAELSLARAIAGQGRLQEAEPHFFAAAKLDTRLRAAPLELAAQYEAKGQKDEALAIYRQFPNDQQAQDRVAALHLQQGDYAEAIPRLEQEVQQHPNNANRLALATAYLKSQQPEKAAPLLETALQQNPSDLEVRLTYGRILRDQKKYAPAAQQFYRVAQAKPDNREAWSELAGVLLLLEQYPETLAALDKVKALGGENAGYWYLRAIVLDKLKQIKPALECYERFLATSDGKHPDEEFKARQRARILQREIQKR